MSLELSDSKEEWGEVGRERERDGSREREWMAEGLRRGLVGQVRRSREREGRWPRNHVVKVMIDYIIK